MESFLTIYTEEPLQSPSCDSMKLTITVIQQAGSIVTEPEAEAGVRSTTILAQQEVL